MPTIDLSTVDPIMYGIPTNFINNITRFGKQTYNIVKDNDPIYIDLTNKHLSNVNTKSKVNMVLANEFVETKYKNNIRKAKNFKHTTDTLIGDRRIKLSNINKFYGIENGKLKIDNIDNFSDETTVIPVRNPNRSKIKKVIQKDNKLHLIDAKNDTTPINSFRLPEKDKIIFSDENGNAIFVNDLRNENVRNKLNKSLETINRYPILIDNGRYDHYSPDGDVDAYVNPFTNKNDMYIIGY